MNSMSETPNNFACPGYSNLYPKQNDKAMSLLKNLPLHGVLQYVIERQAKVQYSFGDAKGEMDLVYEMACYLDDQAKSHLQDLIASHPNQYLFSNMSTLKFIILALQTCDWTISKPLFKSDIEAIYKAYLICNELWTSEQEKGIAPLVAEKNLFGMYLMADVPIIEFKSHKDFRPQIYKAARLFIFMSTTSPYDSYLKMFLAKKGAKTWQDYLTILFSFYSSTIKTSLVQINDANAVYRSFFNLLCVDYNECVSLWTDQDLRYLRERPLLKMGIEGYYMVLNPNLLIDKLYQGVKFDMFEAMLEGGAVNKKGRPFTKDDYGIFLSMLGEDFSEKEIFYNVMSKAFSGIADKVISGTDMDAAKVLAPSDYYVRIGENVFLFEYKDVTLADKIKYSYDYNTTKDGILDRISKDDGKHRKGVGQLLFSINEATNNGSLDKLDPEISKVKTFYPIVITTDRTFSSLGVECILIDSFTNLCTNWNFPKFVRIPMVLDLDTLFIMSKCIHDKVVDFPTIIEQYLNRQDNHIASFDTFYIDEYRNLVQLQKDDIKFLYGDILTEIN